MMAVDSDAASKSGLEGLLESTPRGGREAPLRRTCNIALQELADKTGSQTFVCHFLPETQCELRANLGIFLHGFGRSSPKSFR